MRKTSVMVAVITLLLLVSFSLAAEGDEETTTTGSSTDSTTTQQQDLSGIAKGFQCLEDKIGDCSSLNNQELALTILATPDGDIFDNCVDELEERVSGDHWGNIRDTALAVLALDHAGKNTQAYEEWLLTQIRTPSDLEWYLEQDSNSAAECVFGYNTQDYSVNIGENKKIDRNAGPCLERAQSNFWLKISPTCYDYEFSVECDKAFIAALLYKNGNSPTIHVLEGTQSSPAYGSVKLSVNSKCFGAGNSCDYEATAWATLALLRTGHDISAYIPYLVAISETNGRYLPDAFIYMATNYNDYATRLVSEVRLGDYWLADGSAYDKFYDTALALIALGSSSSEQVTHSKDWLLFSQANDGCWQNSVRDTAIVLWALEGRAGRSGGGSGGTAVTYCSDAGYFCIPSADCPSTEDVSGNYFCPSLSEKCCTTQNLKTCSDFGGSVCSSNQVCAGNERVSLDELQCCTGECIERPQENECESAFYTCMESSCSDSQEPVSSYACGASNQVCCKTKTASPDDDGSLWWLWVLIILIVILIILLIFRKQVGMLWFKMKSKFKKDGGKKGGPSPGRPGPSPGGVPPPVFARPPIRQAPPISRRAYDRRDSAMSDTFKRLREMSR